MKYFVFWGEDRPDGLADRLAVRDEHRAWLRQHPHPIVCRSGGPWLDDEGNMRGSMLVIEAASKADAQAYLDEDPYARVGLFARTQLHEFAWGLGQPTSPESQ